MAGGAKACRQGTKAKEGTEEVTTLTALTTGTPVHAARKPRLLDLFCGGGGAAVGYAAAGFDVVGVDIERMPAYPFEFHQADATAFLAGHWREFDAIHASPPCQGYSTAVTQSDSKWVSYSRGKNEPRLIEPVRDALLALGKPYVIENVDGAKGHLRSPIVLCGSMFDAYPRRHRYFEASFPIPQPEHARCTGRDKAYALANGIDYRDMSVTGKSRRSGSIELWKTLMGMGWPGLRASDLAEIGRAHV